MVSYPGRSIAGLAARLSSKQPKIVSYRRRDIWTWTITVIIIIVKLLSQRSIPPRSFLDHCYL